MQISHQLPFLGVYTQDLKTIRSAASYDLCVLTETPKKNVNGLWIESNPSILFVHLQQEDTHLSYSPLFGQDAIHYRQRNTSIHQEPLAKAVGLKGGTPLTVVDTTAGWGRDSFILASLGAQVIALEQSSALAFILNQNIDISLQHTDIKDIIPRISIKHTSSIEWLNGHEKHDVVYLDPMFPDKSKSALPKKEMRILQLLVGTEIESNSIILLNTALNRANKRVVVKRPLHARPLGDHKPSFSIKGRSARFDGYVLT